jgi:uncharacterized protein (TIGR03546 family)
MFWLQLVSRFIRVLREGDSPGAIAGGFTVGFIVGLTPFLSLQNILLILLAAVVRLNFAAFGLAYFFFGFIAYLFDPWFHSLGLSLLTLPSLQAFYTRLYNLPIAPLTRFYNTLVFGSTVVAIVLAPAIFFAAREGIRAYRRSWAQKFQDSQAVRFVRGLKIVQWYFKVRDLELS